MDHLYRSLLGALIAHLQDGVMAEDEHGTIVVANTAFARMCKLDDPGRLIGTSAHALREQVWLSLLADIDAHRLHTAELRRRRQPHLDFELTLKDGRVLDRDYVPVPGPDGSVVHMWHYRDVTQRRQMERRLRESSDRLRALSAFVEGTREEERRQLARTLHDELGQLFSSIRLEVAPPSRSSGSCRHRRCVPWSIACRRSPGSPTSASPRCAA